MTTLFVSDFHLAPGDAEREDAFLSFLGGPAARAEALFVLGDLFDAWVGDDELSDPVWNATLSALHALSQKGCRIYCQHGNRDFLLGQRFAERCGLTLLPETAVIEIEGHATLLLHGDQLCLDDRDYQLWRRQARDPRWQAQFLGLPLAQRRAIAADLRATSQREKAQKPAEIMDVNAEAVGAALRAAGVNCMIHGHTHRPARHELQFDGQTGYRWVLPDWRPRGGFLDCSPTLWTQRPWPD